MYLSDANPRENVLLYAVKVAAGFVIGNDNWKHFVRWLLYAARRSSTCLGFVIEHLSVRHIGGQPLPIDEIATFIHQQIALRAESAHTSEIVWLIFWARELGITLSATSLAKVTQLRSSCCALTVLDMVQRGLIGGALDVSYWQSFATADGLKSEMWLLAYEVTKKGWWPRSRSNSYIAGHPFFSDLLAQDIEFYDPRRRARPRSGSSFFALVDRARRVQRPLAFDAGYY